MKKSSLLLLLSVVVFTIVSCNKIPNHAKYVPKNAIVVMTVDMDKLSKKLIWNVLTGSEVFDEMQKDIKNEESKKAMKDFSNIGIDPTSSIYVFYTGDMKGDGHPCMVAAMKDAGKFESFLSKNYPQLKIEDNKNYKSCVVENKFLLSWNKEAAIGTVVSGSFSANQMLDDTVSAEGIMMPPANTPATDATKDKAYLAELFSLSGENAITANSNFKKLQNDGHDWAWWINYEEIYKQNKDLNSGELKAFIKDEYFQDAALACGFDFEKGAIETEMDYYFSKQLASIYKKYGVDNIDESLVNNIPSKDISVLICYNLKPKMIEEFLKEFKLDGLASLGLMAIGTSLETIMNAFTGDMVFALTDMKMKAKDSLNNEMMYSSNTPDFNMTYAMGINDASSFETLLAKGVKQEMLIKNGNSYTMPHVENAILIYDKTRMVYSNEKTMAQQFMDKKGNAKEGLPADAWKNMRSNPISVYADIRKILNAIDMNPASEQERQLVEEVKNMFTYAQLYGGKMKGNANHLEGYLNFSNKDENAMIQLINLAMKVKKAEDAKKNQQNLPVKDSLNV